MPYNYGYFLNWKKVNQIPLPDALSDLRHRMEADVANISLDTLKKVWDEITYRLDLCYVTNGAHSEHLLTRRKFLEDSTIIANYDASGPPNGVVWYLGEGVSAQSRHPETMTLRKSLSPDEIANLLRDISENESDGGELSCSNLDSDEEQD
ncbi:hypothetical protein TNCV_2217381 [Trichonephila clavipes]|nr:hypothetical protein TNCV_2217381 [Trichonephila clavipes]